MLWTAPLGAQGQTEQPPKTIDNSQGVTVKPPAGKAEKQEDSKCQNSAAVETAPQPRPINNQVAAEPACGERCQATEQREKDDLIAQQSMARATEGIVLITWIQAGLGGLGLILVAITARYARHAAYEARRAANAAEETVRVERETGEAQTRAYLHIGEVYLTLRQIPDHPSALAPTFVFVIFNTGNSPALEFRWTAKTYCVHSNAGKRWCEDAGNEWNNWGVSIAAGTKISLDRHCIGCSFTDEETQAISREGLKLILTLEIGFVDVFGKKIEATEHFTTKWKKGALITTKELQRSSLGAEEVAAMGLPDA